jgi:hypothetical protein
MDIEQNWNKALKETEIIRARIQPLMSTGETFVPYILLSESSVNQGDTAVRRGEVAVGKPSIIVPPDNPQFQGFEFEEHNGINENSLVNFLLVRGVRLPSFVYDNKTSSLDIFEGDMSKAVKHFNSLLQSEENIKTGLLLGPEDCWPFSLLIFTCTQIARNLDQDIRRLLNDHKNNH